jgi:hypothetical protein
MSRYRQRLMMPPINSTYNETPAENVAGQDRPPHLYEHSDPSPALPCRGVMAGVMLIGWITTVLVIILWWLT